MDQLPLTYGDELEEKFNSKDFSLITEIAEEIKEYDSESISEIYNEVYLYNKNNGITTPPMFGENDIQAHFVFYNLYKLVSDYSKALEHVKLAHRYYVKNTLSYQWEHIVYEAFKRLYAGAVVPDCILPNNKRPDLVINPTFVEVKYHP
nr:hypothetical protein [Fredinandcohnia onubensis]